MNEKKNDIATVDNVFGANFENAQRMAKAVSSSDLVPTRFKNNIPNTLIALDIAGRIGASPLMVMQHLNIINGTPSWSSTFLIAAINDCGKFKCPLRYAMSGLGKDRSCVAWTIDKNDEKLEGPAVTMAMAEAEGWISKSGSKWKTMPELMMRYRAASFFSRLYCPEVTMGMHTTDEIEDAVIITDTRTGDEKKIDLKSKGTTSITELP
jgi:hypothetical protein